MIPVIFQNSDFVVVNKPPGLNFHSEDDLPGLVVLLQRQLEVADIYPVHRLDKMTSGILVFALNKRTAQNFQRMFENHSVEKFYLAISDQKPKKKQGWVKGDMEPARRGSWRLCKTKQNPAITQFVSELIQPGERLYLLKPKTGKTHQLRVAMKSVSAPICGDLRYADKAKAKQESRGYLHAYSIRFQLDNERFSFCCPPDDGERFLSPACQKILSLWQLPWEIIK